MVEIDGRDDRAVGIEDVHGVEPASQADLYRAVADALAGADAQERMPVDPWDAVHTLAVIDATRASARGQQVLEVETPDRAG